MKDTESYFTDEKVANRAEGYTTEEARAGTRRNNEFSRPWRGSSAGGGYSTAGDLLKFTQALASGKLVTLSPETGKPALGGMGLGGGAPGINAALEYEPKNGIATIVLTNFDPPTAMKQTLQISKWLKAVK